MAAQSEHDLVYGPTARALHWLMAVLIIVQAAIGLIMVYDAEDPNIWEWIAETLKLYDVHKVQGLLLLALVLARLGVRITRGVPPEEPTITVWQRELSRLVHAWIYLFLIGVPLLGWIGISLYPALTVFNAITLPALAGPDRPLSEAVLTAHKIAAFTLIALIAVHVSAAFYHYFIRRDGVLRRMLPSAGAPRR